MEFKRSRIKGTTQTQEVPPKEPETGNTEELKTDLLKILDSELEKFSIDHK